MKTLDQILSILKSPTSTIGDNIGIVINNISAEYIDIVRDLYENDCCNIIYKTSNLCALSNINIGDNISIEVNKLRLQKYGYYWQINNYIDWCIYKNALITPAYIGELSIYADTNNDRIRKIDYIIRIIESLKKYCRSSKSKEILIAHNSDIISVSPQFIIDDIDVLDISQCDENIVNRICNPKDILSKIYQNELASFFADHKANQPNIGLLIRNFDGYLMRCNYCIELYVKQFSFTDIKLQIDKSLLDYTDKIQKIVVDTQTRLIAIPAALILAVGYLEQGNSWSIKNIAVFISTIIFIVLIVIFIKNQTEALSIIDESINEYESTLSVNNEENNSTTEFHNKFRRIKHQLSIQYNRLKIIKWCVYSIPLIELILILGYDYIESIFTNTTGLIIMLCSTISFVITVVFKLIILL